MKSPFWIVATLTLIVSTSLKASELDTDLKKASYGFGVDFVNRLKEQNVELDIPSLTQGIEDAASGKELAAPEEALNQAKNNFQQPLRAKLIQRQKEIGEKNLSEGKAFLAKNARKEGVKTTKSGLQYKIIKEGKGRKPGPEDVVVTHYTGTLIDGREFDSSYKRSAPATFPVNGVIKGWTEALQMMKEGAKWQLFIPAELAYGDTARSELIQANSTLIFELELLEVKKAE